MHSSAYVPRTRSRDHRPPVANIGIAIAPISEQYKVPVLGFAIDDRATIKPSGQPYKNMFLFQPSSDQQGAIMADFAVRERNLRISALSITKGMRTQSRWWGPC